MSVKVDSGLRRRYNLVRKTNLANLVRLKEAQAMQVNMLDAKTNLSSLVKLLETGEEEAIVIARAGKPVAKLVGYDEVDVSKRIGIAKGKLHFDYEAFQAMDEEVLEMFGDKI